MKCHERPPKVIYVLLDLLDVLYTYQYFITLSYFFHAILKVSSFTHPTRSRVRRLVPGLSSGQVLVSVQVRLYIFLSLNYHWLFRFLLLCNSVALILYNFHPFFISTFLNISFQLSLSFELNTLVSLYLSLSRSLFISL